MRFECVARTFTGRRSSNEDSCWVDPNIGLCAVADGMGGYEGGEIASQIAIGTVAKLVRRTLGGEDVFWPYPADLSLGPTENLAIMASRLAHDRIMAAKTGKLAQMGTTLAMLMPAGDHLVIAHVGDSRVYRWRNGVLQQLTRDHSLYEQLLASGADLPPKRNYPHANVITRALGITECTGMPDLTLDAPLIGDVYLLCTDGLSEVLSEERISALLSVLPLKEACASLIDEAFENGSRDNITAVLARRAE